MQKKFYSWLLAIGMLVFLAGCGGGEQTSNTDTQPDTTANQNENTNTQDNQTADNDTDSSTTDSTATDTDTSTTDTSTADNNTTSADAAALANRDDHLSLSDGTVLRVPFTELPRYFLPNATEGTWESTISGMVFEYLMQSNDNLENIPGIATSEWDPSTLTYSFHLKPGVKFHDGEELQCDDVMFSYKAWTHPDYPGPRFGNFENIVGAYDFRNRIFDRIDLTEELVMALDAQMEVPEAITNAYMAYGIDLTGSGSVEIFTSETDESGAETSQSWQFTNAAGKTYMVKASDEMLTLHLTDGMEIAWPIEGLNCADAYTMEVTLDSVQRTFVPYAVASSGIMPQHIYEPFLDENGFAMMQGAELTLFEEGKLVGTGPYKFAEWNEGNFVKLVRNDDYWQTRTVAVESQYPLGGVEEIYFLFTPDQQAQFERLQANEVDVLDTRPAVNQYFDLQSQTDRFDTYEYSQLVYDYWHWNLRNPLFQNVNVRKAMCHALDRQEMVDQVLQGLGEVANGPTHPLRWDWDDTLREVHPSFDIATTIELMEGAGWTIEKNDDGTIKEDAVWTTMGADGEEILMEFEIATNQGNNRRLDYIIMMVEMLRAAGFNASTRTIPTNSFYNDYLDGSFKFETAVAGWRMGTDPDGTSVWHSKSIGTAFNWHAYSNPAVDAIIEEGLQYEDLSQALPIYQKMNRMLVEDAGYCWLAFMKGTFGSKNEFTNLSPWSPLGPYSNIVNWFVEGKGVAVATASPSD